MKKKLSLDVAKLDIEAFEVQPDSVGPRGTVQAFDLSMPQSDPCRLCPEMPITYSCEATPCC
jgi:hypothetical protein